MIIHYVKQIGESHFRIEEKAPGENNRMWIATGGTPTILAEEYIQTIIKIGHRGKLDYTEFYKREGSNKNIPALSNNKERREFENALKCLSKKITLDKFIFYDT